MSNTKSKNKKQNKKLDKDIRITKKNIYISIIVIFLLGVLLIFSTYAWFSTSLNVKVKTFKMKVERNSGITISLDAINYDYFVEIDEKNIISDLLKTYPNHINRYSNFGLIPVSSVGMDNPDNYLYKFYQTSGVLYQRKAKRDGFIYVNEIKQDEYNEYSEFIAFDLFFKNVTGSPYPDNLFLGPETFIKLISNVEDEEQIALLNSVRMSLVFVGWVPNGTDPTTIQNLQCNNECTSFIYEPYANNHTEFSINKLKKYNIEVNDGEYFPTYAMVKEGGPIFLKNNISGSKTMDLEYFKKQATITEDDLSTPIYQIKDGVTKARLYIWIEGQDIDSLETNSSGAELEISIDFEKDTNGYRAG